VVQIKEFEPDDLLSMRQASLAIVEPHFRLWLVTEAAHTAVCSPSLSLYIYVYIYIYISLYLSLYFSLYLSLSLSALHPILLLRARIWL